MTKPIKPIEFLEATIKMGVPKKQRNQKFKATDKKVRGAIVSKLDELKSDVDAAIIDKLFTMYKNNLVTNEHVAEILLKSTVKSFIEIAAENVKDIELTKNEMKSLLFAVEGAVEKALAVAVKNKEDFDVISEEEIITMGIAELEKHPDVLKPTSLVLNEFIYGSRVKRGVGYDHILDMTPYQVQRYALASSI